MKTQGTVQVTKNLVVTDGMVVATLTYPVIDGDADQVIATDGAGTLTFVSQTGGGGGSADIIVIQAFGG